jgi:hypothetical protein
LNGSATLFPHSRLLQEEQAARVMSVSDPRFVTADPDRRLDHQSCFCRVVVKEISVAMNRRR